MFHFLLTVTVANLDGKFIFKLNMVNFNTWTKVKLSWHATCHSYDVIELVSKLITQSHGVFIPVFIDAKSMKIDQEMQDL